MTTDLPAHTLETRLADLVCDKVRDQRLRTGLLASDFCRMTRLAELIEDPEEAWHQAGLIPKVGGKTLRSFWSLLRAEVADLLSVLPAPEAPMPPGPVGMLHDLSCSLTRALAVMDEQLAQRVILDPPLPSTPTRGSAQRPLPRKAILVCGAAPTCLKTPPVLAAEGQPPAGLPQGDFERRLLAALLAEDALPAAAPTAIIMLHGGALSDLLLRQGRYAPLSAAEVEDQIAALRHFERSLGLRARMRVAEFTLRRADEIILGDGLVAARLGEDTTVVEDRTAFNQLRRQIARADSLHGTSFLQFLTNARSASPQTGA